MPERVGTAREVVAFDQHLVRGVQKDEFGQHAVFAQRGDRARKIFQEIPRANVHTDRKTHLLTRGGARHEVAPEGRG